MPAAETNLGRAAPKRAVARLGAAVLVGVALLAAGGYLWLRAQPVPPEPDLAGADPQLVQAITEARLAVLHAPRHAMPWGHLGMVLYQHRFLSEARTCFSEAERLDPQEVRWPYLIAQIDRLENQPAAIAALERARAVDEHNAVVRLQLAELLMEQGRLDDAQGHFQRVVESPGPQAPLEQARAALGLARVALYRDQLADALELAQRAEQANPAMKAPRVVLAEIHLRRGEAKAAQREQQKLLTSTEMKWPDPYVEEMERLSVEVHPKIELARRFLAQNRAAEGLALIEEILRDYPQSLPAWISMGQAHLRLQQWQQAQAATERALALQPGDAIALADLGYALSRQELLERAADCYRKAIASNPHSPENYYHLSSCELRRGRTEKAIDALRMAVRVRPHFGLAWRELGQILAGQGERAEAGICLQRAVELAPDDEVARKLLADLR